MISIPDKVIEQVEQKFQEFVGFDFANHALSDFLKWLEKRENRTIWLIPVPMPVGIFGAWQRDALLPYDYIFYADDLSGFKKEHTIRHEALHLALGHKTWLVPNYDEGAKQIWQMYNQLKLRSIFERDLLEEQEAEAMALIMMAQSDANIEETILSDYLKVMG